MIAIREFLRTQDEKTKLQISKRHFDLAIDWLKAQKGE